MRTQPPVPAPADALRPARPRVVVGVGESPAGAAALSWARDLCRRHRWRLEVVTAWPDSHEPLIHEVPGHFSVARHRAVSALETALRAQEVEVDGSGVRVFVENADPVAALVQHSRGATTLVLGAASTGRSRREGVAPMAQVCARQVDCDVVVVDPDHTPHHSVLPARAGHQRLSA